VRCRAAIAALTLAFFLPSDECAASGGKRHVRLLSAPVALTSPLASERLTAGESTVLSWVPLADLGHHPWLEEWEAFLSLDGGATYPVRLTPHLDLERRSFAVEIPGFATRQARLMLRFGDENREVEFEFPDLFEILPARDSPLEPANLARGRGESARAGEVGVTIWMEGGRAGFGARQVVAAARGSEIEGIETHGLLGLPPVGPAPGLPQVVIAEASTHPLAGTWCAWPEPPAAPPRADTLEPRRRTCRQNE